MFSKIVLLTFSILYFLLALWCALLPEETSNTIGLSLLGSSGHSEYFVVYVGLELALAIFFLIAFLKKEYYSAGILFAFLSSICLFIARILSFILFSGLSEFQSITLITFATECLMTLFSAIAFFSKNLELLRFER